jgi:hypothetical protein
MYINAIQNITYRMLTKHKEQNALSITAKNGKLLNKYEKQIFK